MVIRFLLLLLLCILFPGLLRAQNNFVAGYIVKPGNDTIRGELNDLQWKQGPYAVEFRQTGVDVRQYAPTELAGFGFGNNHYRSARVLIRTSPIAPTNKLIYGPTPEQQYTQIFLKEIARGKYTLYLHKSGNEDPHFFIQGNADTLVELIIHRYLIQAGTGYLSSEVLKYRQQLGYYFSDCKKILARLNSLPYTEKAIQRIFDDYHSCVDPTYQPKEGASNKQRFQISVHGGYASTRINLKTERPDWEGASLSNAGSSFGTISLELSGSRTISRTYLFLEIGHRSFASDGSHTKIYTNIFRDEFSYRFEMTYLALQAGGRYEFSGGKVRPFVCGGLSFGLGLDQRGSMTRKTYLNDVNTSTETVDPLADYRRLDAGIMLGAGTCIGRFRLQLNYIPSNGFSEYSDFSAKLSRLEGRLGFRIL